MTPCHAMHVCPLTYNRSLTYTESARVTCATVIRDRFLISGRDVCVRARARVCIYIYIYIYICEISIFFPSFQVCAVKEETSKSSPIHRPHL